MSKNVNVRFGGRKHEMWKVQFVVVRCGKLGMESDKRGKRANTQK
jgi:hypothetical protein